MAQTKVKGAAIQDGSVQRVDLDTTTAGQAVTAKIIPGTNVTISSTGVDAGTGDVTINVPDSVGFDTYLLWDFDTTTDGWTVVNGTITYSALNGGSVVVADTAATAVQTAITSPSGLTIPGSKYTRVKVGISRIAGTEANLIMLYTDAANPTFAGAVAKAISTPAGLSNIGEFVVLDFDMENLTLGGNDWINSTITQLRLLLTSSTSTHADDQFRIHWIAVGRNAPVIKTTGSVAGNSGEIQFNNSGVFGGAANVQVESGNLGLIPISVDPTVSATRTLIYPLDIAGRMVPKWSSPGEPDNVFQASVHFNNFSTIGPAGGTTVGTTNCTVTNVGTISHPTPGTASLRNQTKRFLNTSAATAGALASTRVTVVECWRGNAAELGGFFISMRMGLETLQAGNRGFFGLHNSTTAPTNIDPLADTTLTKLGIGFNTNTGNLFLIHNPAGTAPTTIDLGANFPVNNTNFYEFVFYCNPNAATITYRFRNLTTGAAATTGTISTNMPASTTFLARTAWMTNNATAAAVAWHINKFNLETDY
jgi:hypothetical protein